MENMYYVSKIIFKRIYTLETNFKELTVIYYL